MKVKEFLKNNRKVFLKFLLVIGIIAVIAVSTYFLLRAFGFTTVQDFIQLRDWLDDSILFWLIIVLLQIVQVVFIPISNSLISAPIAVIFSNELWKVFLSSWIGISIGTIFLYFIGKYAGGSLLNFVLGDKNKAERLKGFMLQSKAFFVIGDVIPVIPNDVLTVLAGMSGYGFWFTLIVTLITRAICVATTVWIFGYITTYPWIIAILICLIIFMIFAGIYVTKRSIRKQKEKEEQEQAKNCPYYKDCENICFYEWDNEKNEESKER